VQDRKAYSATHLCKMFSEKRWKISGVKTLIIKENW